jgi:hypothetical protein
VLAQASKVKGDVDDWCFTETLEIINHFADQKGEIWN